MSSKPPDPHVPPRAGAAPPSHRAAAPKKNWIIGGVAGLVLLGIGGAVAAVNAGGDGDPEAAATTRPPSAATPQASSTPDVSSGTATQTQPTTTTTTNAPAGPATATQAPGAEHEFETEPEANRVGGAGFGNSVRNGDLELTVTALDCSRTSLGSGARHVTAQGKFCIVSLTVKNISGSVQTFTGSLQRAIGADGTEFANDSAAEIYANGNSPAFVNKIKPGGVVKGRLAFDVSQSTTLTSIELRDASYSQGVTVSLR
jgi:hypothetical protein